MSAMRSTMRLAGIRRAPEASGSLRPDRLEGGAGMLDGGTLAGALSGAADQREAPDIGHATFWRAGATR